MPNDLLFINSTQGSTQNPQRRRAERIRIQSHVQQKRRRAEQRRAAQPWAQHSSTIILDGTDEGDEAEEKKPPAVEPLDPGQTAYLTNNTTDPFNATVAAGDAEAHVLLRSTFYIASRGNFLAEAYAPASVVSSYTRIRHAHIFHARLRHCVYDETLMYATLAYSASFWAWMTGSFVQGTRSPEYLLAKAVQSMRQRLSVPRSQPTDGWLLLSVYSLAITEMWNGHPYLWMKWPERSMHASQIGANARASSRVHLNALVKLVAEAGGWHRFDRYILESSLLADKYLCVLEMTEQPVIPFTWNDASKLEDVTELLPGAYNIILPRLASKLCGLSSNSELGILISKLAKYIRIAHFIWRTPQHISDPVESWLFTELQALTIEFYRTFHDSDQALDRLICLSILSFIFGTMSHPGPRTASRHPTQRARELLIQHGTSLTTEMEEGLTLWVLCTHAIIPAPCVEREWFKTEVARYLPVGMNGMALVDILEDYLFLPERQMEVLLSMFRDLRLAT